MNNTDHVVRRKDGIFRLYKCGELAKTFEVRAQGIFPRAHFRIHPDIKYDDPPELWCVSCLWTLISDIANELDILQREIGEAACCEAVSSLKRHCELQIDKRSAQLNLEWWLHLEAHKKWLVEQLPLYSKIIGATDPSDLVLWFALAGYALDASRASDLLVSWQAIVGDLEDWFCGAVREKKLRLIRINFVEGNWRPNAQAH
jgi:hypothetical protein